MREKENELTNKVEINKGLVIIKRKRNSIRQRFETKSTIESDNPLSSRNCDNKNLAEEIFFKNLDDDGLDGWNTESPAKQSLKLKY